MTITSPSEPQVNPERWYYHADRHGIAVLQDVPEKYGGTSAATVPLYHDHLVAVVAGPRNGQPCIIQWTPFNEGDMMQPPWSEEGYLRAVVATIRSLDSNSRLIDINSGGPANGLGIGDVNDCHTYTDPKDVPITQNQYGMIGEYSNVASFVVGHEWQPGQCA
jgi:hypothetical protein